jgi:predicted membrane protein DUF2306
VGHAIPRPAPADDRLFRWTGRFFYFAAVGGLAVFGIYIILRATGLTESNFQQWRALVAGLPMPTAADWISNIGIGMHYVMGTVLVLAWPILFSARIRSRHRAVHRWTGRVYVTAGFLAGVGGMSFILARHNGGPAHVAFAIWGSVMMLSATLTYTNARARRFVVHRAWAIRLFAMVLGSWLYDLEVYAWRELTNDAGMTDAGDGPLDYLFLYFFFVPNLLVAELFIRNQHRRLALARNLKWPVWAAVAITGVILIYSIVLVTATHGGKYGKHLLGSIERFL